MDLIVDNLFPYKVFHNKFGEGKNYSSKLLSQLSLSGKQERLGNKDAIEISCLNID